MGFVIGPRRAAGERGAGEGGDWENAGDDEERLHRLRSLVTP